MTGSRLVAARQLPEVVDALAAGRAVAVPGDAGYQVAVNHNLRDAVAMLQERWPDTAETGLQIAIGRRSQAAELTPHWSREASQLTDRMWPGPLTVIVPAPVDECLPPHQLDRVVHLTMPAWRPLRVLCGRSGPLVVKALRRVNGEPLVTAEEVQAQLSDGDVALVLDGGMRRGPGPTVVDCTQSPPRVCRVGALPESYVEAALLMGARRRRWSRRRGDAGRP
jgi:tRNA A37 threonylcarbamoyladenosine synthetase subunit TsaC/SUA5/YrdC